MNEILLNIEKKYKNTRRRKEFLEDINNYVDKHYADEDFNADDVRQILKTTIKE